MGFEDNREERAESYRVLAQLFSAPPDDDVLAAAKSDFELESKDSAGAVADDFNYLFSQEGILPPAESLYRIASGANKVEDIIEFYRSSGLMIGDVYDVVPDHISLEFTFMVYLVGSGQIDLQKKFLDEHVMNWVPYYCEEVMKLARTVFYREIAEITRDFLEEDYANLQ